MDYFLQFGGTRSQQKIPGYKDISVPIQSSEPRVENVPWLLFLRDVFTCSLGAYGGPEAHMSIFLDTMVIKRNYLSETDLIELIALCSILPGPTSTQTIVAIGYKMGGPVLAFFTMLIWGLPVLVVMTLLSFLYQFMETQNISTHMLRYIGPMAVGFIVVAAYRISRKVVTDRATALLLIGGAILTWFIRDPWVFPLALVSGGFVSLSLSKEKKLWTRVELHPPWGYLISFVTLALGGIVLAHGTGHRLAILVESFYRYGYLVFGGGQVVVPVMHTELVQIRQYLSNQEFLTGYGLVQGLPGPMFSFAAYAGGMAARGGSAPYQILGAMAGGIGIFLPGLLLIYFVYPIWEKIRTMQGIRIALKGIAAVAGGLISAAALTLMQTSGLNLQNLVVVVVSILLLISKRVPAPLIVLGTLAAGFFL